ncbi:MAG: NYN domain-containing protein [Planctomycetia bacterium]|nr:NYN domain-containing protein [Planctomycetia bacterium]
MSARILLIDGYNLLHAAGMGQLDYRPGDLLRCRTRLLAYLLDKLSHAEIRAATLVFDARDPPPDRPAELVVSGLKVQFANPGGDADVAIQQWLSRHPSPRRVMLVSSDRALQRAARVSGSKFVGSHEFLEELERRRSSQRRGAGRQAGQDESEKPGGQPSAAQTAHWLKVFGDAPVVDDEPDPPQPPAAPSPTPPKPPAPHQKEGRRPRQRKAKSPDETKPTGSIDPHELQEWLKAFQTGEGAAESADDRRRSDLEAWLRDFQARDRNRRD